MRRWLDMMASRQLPRRIALDAGMHALAAMAETARRTRQLAKRQMTWFRHQTRVSWISVTASMPLDDITAKVSSDWDQHGPQPVVLQ